MKYILVIFVGIIAKLFNFCIFSGISNESPETHSSGEHHLHPLAISHRGHSPHAHFTSTPPVIHSPPHSPITARRDAEAEQMSMAQMEHHCR